MIKNLILVTSLLLRGDNHSKRAEALDLLARVMTGSPKALIRST
jgi:hypothetical protein